MNEVHVMKGTRLGKYLACAFAATALLCVPAFGASGAKSDSEVQAQQQRKTATGIVVYLIIALITRDESFKEIISTAKSILSANGHRN